MLSLNWRNCIQETQLIFLSRVFVKFFFSIFFVEKYEENYRNFLLNQRVKNEKYPEFWKTFRKSGGFQTL